jgi:pseudouridine-5'-phosphate glycosidase
MTWRATAGGAGEEATGAGQEQNVQAGTSGMPAPPVVSSEQVAHAVAAGGAVVALESTIIAHGLPRPRNLAVASELESVVGAEGVCPATVAVLDGVPRVGLDAGQLERIALQDGVRKLGLRDLPLAVATRATGATTISATAYLAALVGVRTLATGGLGGVHRGWVESRDESADLDALRRTRITIVTAGVKSILDVAATLERLETLSVSVVGFRTDEFPGFYLRSSGHRLDWRLDEPAEVAAVMAAQDELGITGALVVANPVEEAAQLDPGLHDRVLADALDEAASHKVNGQAMTPFLLDKMVRGTGGAALEANLAAVRGNCAVAAGIALAWSTLLAAEQ